MKNYLLSEVDSSNVFAVVGRLPDLANSLTDEVSKIVGRLRIQRAIKEEFDYRLCKIAKLERGKYYDYIVTVNCTTDDEEEEIRVIELTQVVIY